MKDKYPIVNDNDEVVGNCDKEEAYEKKHMLRSIQIFVYDSNNKIVIQKRSKNKKRFPGYWCAATAGHVENGENYDEAAARELKEELGITEKLRFITKSKTPVGDGIFAMMAHYKIVSDKDFTLQKEEVEEIRHVTENELGKMIESNELFTPSFLYYFNNINNKNHAI